MNFSIFNYWNFDQHSIKLVKMLVHFLIPRDIFSDLQNGIDDEEFENGLLYEIILLNEVPANSFILHIWIYSTLCVVSHYILCVD